MAEYPNQNFSEEKPSTSLHNPSADLLARFSLINEVFQQIENETAEIAEMIFDYLVNVSDEEIMTGTILPHKNKRVNGYIKILNRLFLFSRSAIENAGIRIINRKIIEDLEKKTFAICMCYDGGFSLDILCDIVNIENKERTPTTSPVKVTVKKFSRASGKAIS